MTATQDHTVKISRVYLDLEGLAMFLGGELQAVVYSVVLATPGITLKAIHEYINLNYSDVTLSTVATVANKLVDKNIFQRVNTGIGERKRYCYTALINYDELVETAIKRTFDRLFDQHTNAAFAYAITMPNKG